ncbi:MAG: hypothetical protein QNJ55_01630 [Xenococcus sp. MO_188.B8]|nr:hypothetical protein [Xenococcus sp. MO_188.B8]
MLKRILNQTIHKMPLRTTLIVPFVLQIAIAVGLVSYLSYRNSQLIILAENYQFDKILQLLNFS